MLFSKADGGREEAVEVPPGHAVRSPFEDDLENGLREKSGIPDEAADFTLPAEMFSSENHQLFFE
jgi:hypothetical protein